MLRSVLHRKGSVINLSRAVLRTTKRNVIVSKSILGSIPQSAITESLWPKLREAVMMDPRRLIVLDDDPTGCQTVYDINVLLDYSVTSIEEQLKLDDKLFYILTNTRSLGEADAISVTKHVIDNIQTAVKNVRYPHTIQYISRSDSTLRGHHPAEVEAIAEALNVPFESTIVMPGQYFWKTLNEMSQEHETRIINDLTCQFIITAFFEGGRLTFNDVHYVQEGENLIPAGETPFANDAHFGFKASNLKDWVVEKTGGAVKRENVSSISLNDIREGGPATVANILESQQHGNTVIVNGKREVRTVHMIRSND